jgi:hypothetical protein
MHVVINYITVDNDFIPYQDAQIEAFNDETTIDKLKEFIERNALKEKRWVLRNKGQPLWERKIYKNATLNEFKGIADNYEKRRIVVRLTEFGDIDAETVKLFNQLKYVLFPYTVVTSYL